MSVGARRYQDIDGAVVSDYLLHHVSPHRRGGDDTQLLLIVLPGGRTTAGEYEREGEDAPERG